MRNKGFTLIELITVMGISAVLLTIISIPLIQSFNLTRVAQGFADAQDRARLLMDQITSEIQNASGVRDNSGLKGALVIVVPGQNGQPEPILFENVKLDIVMPAAGDPVLGPSGALRNPNSLIDPNGDPNDPNNWREDPTLRAPTGQVVLPSAQGTRLVRYFIGLRNPVNPDTFAAVPYNNPHDGLLMARGGEGDNLYVLYRAEVDLRVWDRNAQRWVYNTDLFDIDTQTGQPILDDPSFFIADGTQAKARRIQQWLNRSVVVTPVRRLDMIRPVFNTGNRQVAYDGNVPRVVPLIQFRPTRISSEPAEGMTALRSGEETANADKLAADVFLTEFGAWTSAKVKLYPSVYEFGTVPQSQVWDAWDNTSPYLYSTDLDRDPGPDQDLGYAVTMLTDLGAEPNTGAALEIDELLGRGYVVFDQRAYDWAQAGLNRGQRRYPFSEAVLAANAITPWLADPIARQQFVPFVGDPRRGRVTASFPITEVGNSAALGSTEPDNRPLATIGDAVLPQNDGVGQNLAANDVAPNRATSQINRRFNMLWNHWDTPSFAGGAVPRAGNVKRFIDLRVLPLADGTASPLHPTLGFPRARIVPGSEEVIGPDQLPGPNYGRLTRYTRVLTGDPGPNEYKINYVDIGGEPDYSLLGLTPPANHLDPRSYDPSNFVSAYIQPRFKAGYVEFNSRPNEPLPAGRISVFYRFQFTDPNDSVAVDYDTREVMQVDLTIRNFPGTALPNPQSVTVSGSATVRNFLR